MALVNPGGSRPPDAKASMAHTTELKDVVRSTLALEADEAILIQQLACIEPGCPPTETVVAVLGSPRRSWKFAMPTADVTVPLLRDTLTKHPKGRNHDEHN